MADLFYILHSRPLSGGGYTVIAGDCVSLQAAKDVAEKRPVPVEIIWTHREGTRKTGLMQLGPLGAVDGSDEATFRASGRTDQFLITGGTRRTTIDAFNDYDPQDQLHLKRVTVEEAAHACADWCGFKGRTVDVKIHDEAK